MSSRLSVAYSNCVKIYNEALLDSSLHLSTKTVDEYMRSREIVLNSVLDSNYCAGGRFDYITILRKLGFKRQRY